MPARQAIGIITYSTLIHSWDLAVAIGNSGEIEAAAALGDAHTADRHDAGSIGTPLVAEHVAWARDRLLGQRNLLESSKG